MSADVHPMRLADVIGHNVKQWRSMSAADPEAPTRTVELDGREVRALPPRMTQAVLAERVRRLGVPWTEATVASVELGRREPSILELAALCAVFGVGVGQLLHSITGRPVTTPGGVVHDPLSLAAALTDGDPLDEGRTGSRLVDEVTRKVAARSGQSAQSLDRAARQRYGRSLPEERDARLGPDAGDLSPRSLQARRGHVMRVLLAELRDEVQP
jgi:transcriptional regulator with XRE-family HTH domain